MTTENLHALHAQNVDQCFGLENTFSIQKYDNTILKDKNEIKKLDEILFNETPTDDFYAVNGYFIRDPQSTNIVSYILYEIKSSNALYISSLGTDSKFEGQGLASMLVEHVLNQYRGYNITLKVNIWENAPDPNKLIRFYQRLGFIPIYKSITYQYKS